MEEDRIRRFAELREKLESRVKNLEAELDDLRDLLEFVNEALVEKSFKKAEEITKPHVTALQKKTRTVELRTDGGEVLGNIYIDEGSMRIIPDPSKLFNTKTPPFSSFFVDKILNKMKNKDEELAREGKISQEKIFSFEIIAEENMLKQIIIKNVDGQREREITSAIRWTLEKMYQKIRESALS
ncbi:MAG: hypothetical protein RMJ07_01740 [Nitrososphaerota archaeon]|nr:hypothetical protein [Candidatus Bathyarchaeota archaeon]MDW8048390.1 hypothetical protein [Nitrososphaerota archaeon]